MNRTFSLTGELLAANPVVSAQAGGHDESARGMCKVKGDRMTMAWHKMMGTVDRIDYASGMLTLKSRVPDVTLHFPPAFIKDLKIGDTVTVDLGFSKGRCGNFV